MLNQEVENQTIIETNTTQETTWKQFLFELFQTIILAVILYFLIDSVIARVRVLNISMIPTLQPGEFLLVNKMAYKLGDITRGDIIVFHFPADPKEDYIKRAIGLPGDQVEINSGQVYVNGIQLTEPYIKDPPLYSGNWMIPEHSVFVLGDNRNQSSDSHNWGLVPLENIVGKAIMIYWPFDQFKVLSHPKIL